jgi:hypothetical protein
MANKMDSIAIVGWRSKKEKTNCHNPNLGLVTKVRAWKGVGRECNPKVTFTFPRVQESVRE